MCLYVLNVFFFAVACCFQLGSLFHIQCSSLLVRLPLCDCLSVLCVFMVLVLHILRWFSVLIRFYFIRFFLLFVYSCDGALVIIVQSCSRLSFRKFAQIDFSWFVFTFSFQWFFLLLLLFFCFFQCYYSCYSLLSLYVSILTWFFRNAQNTNGSVEMCCKNIRRVCILNRCWAKTPFSLARQPALFIETHKHESLLAVVFHRRVLFISETATKKFEKKRKFNRLLVSFILWVP